MRKSGFAIRSWKSEKFQPAADDAITGPLDHEANEDADQEAVSVALSCEEGGPAGRLGNFFSPTRGRCRFPGTYSNCTS